MNGCLDRPRVLLALVACSVSLALAACGGKALDVRAAEPAQSASEPSAFDPALDSLEAVTHHG